MDGVPKALRSSLSLQFEANLVLRTMNHNPDNNPDVSQLFALSWKQQERNSASGTLSLSNRASRSLARTGL